jgi:hypothetical protein
MTISNIRKLSASNRYFLVIDEFRDPPDVGSWQEIIYWLDTYNTVETFLESDLQKASESVDEDLAEKRWPNAVARGKLEIEKRRKK